VKILSEGIEYHNEIETEVGVYKGYMKGEAKHGPGTFHYNQGSKYNGEYCND